jgi:hypothetical protein
MISTRDLFITIILLLAALLLPAAPALAVYTQEASTFSAGGGASTSTNYENLGVIGQPGIVGSSAGGTHTANHGFLSVLGDGFKLLYPVIATSPGTLTFSLKAGASGNMPLLGISNTGGSTLNWTVTKSIPDTIFTFDPAIGSETGNVTVTASAAGLTPNVYSNTLTISGAGIEQTVLVQLDLTVTPANYTLAVTLKQAVPGKGGGTVTSTAPDTRLSCDNRGATGDVFCSQDFPADTTITLFQAPGTDSQWATWGFTGCGSSQTCQVALTGPQGSTVSFPYSSMALVNSLSAPANGFESLVLAYGSASPTDTINARAVPFTEGLAGSLVTLSGKTINLVGGLDAYYLPTTDYSTIRNILKIGTGRLNIKGGVKIHP